MRERPAQPTSPADPPFHVVMRNGYTYSIDPGGRTRQVSGYLTLAKTPMRSRVSQLRAGGADRRRTDEGGHYIAVRFSGPTEAFNHSAQDRTFNRSGYRQLENQWAKARRAGERVFVRLNPVYSARSLRPDRISVYYTIDGHEERSSFSNGNLERRHVGK